MKKIKKVLMLVILAIWNIILVLAKSFWKVPWQGKISIIVAGFICYGILHGWYLVYEEKEKEIQYVKLQTLQLDSAIQAMNNKDFNLAEKYVKNLRVLSLKVPKAKILKELNMLKDTNMLFDLIGRMDDERFKKFSTSNDMGITCEYSTVCDSISSYLSSIKHKRVLFREQWLKEQTRIKRETRLAEVRKKKEEKKAKQLKIKQMKETRIKYGKLLRNKYLDQGLDIKVNVSGTNKDRITLSFSLFNDVWSHNFSKGTFFDEIKLLGFKRLVMTDNYDYTVYWQF